MAGELQVPIRKFGDLAGSFMDFVRVPQEGCHSMQQFLDLMFEPTDSLLRVGQIVGIHVLVVPHPAFESIGG
jgi:hypothetical protein